MPPIPLNVLTLYADLLEQAETASPDEGTVVATTIKGIRYLRLQRWVGASRTVEHLGRADDPDILVRVEEIQAAMARRAERRKTVTALARLISGPSSALGKVLDVIAAAGLFRRGVLVGTGAYQCYAPLVGHTLPSSALMTQDLDLATADLALSADEPLDKMETILRRADPSFTGVPSLDPRAPPARFRAASGFIVDLLTPRLRRSDKSPMPMTNLGAGAIPIQQLDWLIREPATALALHGAGILVKVPQPARYAVHKLIVAQKRPASEGPKRQKDLIQAKALLDALANQNPFALEDALADARKRGREGWSQPIDRSLKEIERLKL